MSAKPASEHQRRIADRLARTGLAGFVRRNANARSSARLAQVPAPNPNAKACAWLPMADLEAHFGTKAQVVQGLDQITRNTCTARFADVYHVAAIESHPPSPVDAAMSVAERIAFVKQGVKGLESRDFGSIGCFRSTQDMGKPVHVTTCFVAKAQYLSLALHSTDPQQHRYEIVKGLLEKAAGLRK